MKIVHVTTVHARHDVRIFLKECTSLCAAGHDVTLVVADGKGDGCEDGIRIIDIGRRSGNRLLRMWRDPKVALPTVMALRPDVVHAHDPELLPLLSRISRHGVRTIYDAHEDVPRQILTKHWIPKLLRPMVAYAFERYEIHTVRKFSAVVGATRAIAERFSALGVRAQDINNYPLLMELTSECDRVGKSRQVCYVGGITKVRGVKQIVDALPQVPGVRLALCGTFGEPGLEEVFRASPGWGQVDYLGHVDRDTTRAVMACSLAGLVTFEPAPNHLDAQPNKLFEYMAAGLPVIGSDFPLWRELLVEAGCGICVDPMSPTAIAAAIIRLDANPSLAQELGRKGRCAVQERFNWDAESKRLLDLYQELQ